MGLKEKKAVQKVQDGQSKFEDKLAKIIGKSYTFEVDWDSFMENETAIRMIPNGAFDRIVKGIKKVCSDDMGKEAMLETLKSISIKQIDDPSEKSVTFDSGALNISIALHNTSKGIFTDTEYSKIIMAAL